MKKILLLCLTISFLISGTTKDYTVGEMLNKFYSSSDKIEGVTRKTDFNMIQNYLPDYSDKEQEILKKVYLYYLYNVSNKKEDFSHLTSLMEEFMNQADDVQEKGTFISIINSNNVKYKLITNQKYYLDIKNQSLYSEVLKNFNYIDTTNLYSIKWEEDYKRLLVQEPQNSENGYFNIINLEKDTKIIKFKDLEEVIKIYQRKILEENK